MVALGFDALNLVLYGIFAGQVRELGAYFIASRHRRLRNDIGDLPIGAGSLGAESSDGDALDFAAAGHSSGNPQTFRL